MEWMVKSPSGRSFQNERYPGNTSEMATRMAPNRIKNHLKWNVPGNSNTQWGMANQLWPPCHWIMERSPSTNSSQYTPTFSPNGIKNLPTPTTWRRIIIIMNRQWIIIMGMVMGPPHQIKCESNRRNPYHRRMRPNLNEMKSQPSRRWTKKIGKIVQYPHSPHYPGNDGNGKCTKNSNTAERTSHVWNRR